MTNIWPESILLFVLLMQQFIPKLSLPSSIIPVCRLTLVLYSWNFPCTTFLTSGSRSMKCVACFEVSIGHFKIRGRVGISNIQDSKILIISNFRNIQISLFLSLIVPVPDSESQSVVELFYDRKTEKSAYTHECKSISYKTTIETDTQRPSRSSTCGTRTKQTRTSNGPTKRATKI